MLFRVGLLYFLSIGFGALADERGEPEATFGTRAGYLFDVQAEKDKRDLEMVLLEKPKPTGPPIRDVIFNQKLSREFQLQYEYRFGTTAAEQTINSVSRDNFQTTGQNLTIKEYREKQRAFGEYMGRRLTEYHVDNWAKSDPDIRPLYEVKDKISNVTVQTKSGYKLKFHYSFAGNSMDLRVDNPYKVETQVRVLMRSGQFSPEKPEETIYSLGYQMTKKVKVTSIYKQEDGVFEIVGTRPLSPRISTSLTGSFDGRREGPTVQQSLVLVGLSWRD